MSAASGKSPPPAPKKSSLLKWLGRIVLFLLVLAVVAVGIGFALPDHTHVERSIKINAPADVVFDQVNDLKRWEKWEPWSKEEFDDTLEVKFEGSATGVGAERSWEGKKAGEGRQKITVSKAPSKVEFDMWFMGAENPSHGSFVIEPAGEFASDVTWTYDEDHGNNPIARLMGKLLVEPVFVGPPYEKGLAKLKKVAEAAIPPDDPAAVKALEEAQITLTYDKSDKKKEHVIGVSFANTNTGDKEAEYLRGLPNITKLSLGVPGITDKGLDHITSLVRLKELDLSASGVTDAGVPILKQFPRLETLDMDRTSLTDAGFEHLCQIPNIRRLVVSRTLLTDAGMEHLKHCPKLRLLDLMDITGISDAGFPHIGKLTELQSLKVWGSSIGDAGVAELKDCTKMKTLGLDRTNVTSEGLKTLEGLPELEELYLFGAVRVRDDGLASLTGLKKLKRIRLRGLIVTGKGLEYLKECQALTTIDLSESTVKDAGLEHLAELPKLIDLNLWACDVTDAGVEKLTPLKDMEKLNLDKTLLTDEGCKHLLGFKKLKYLHIGSTKVTDEGLKTLHGLKDCKDLKDLIITFLPQTTSDEVEALKKALPGVKVES